MLHDDLASARCVDTPEVFMHGAPQTSGEDPRGGARTSMTRDDEQNGRDVALQGGAQPDRGGGGGGGGGGYIHRTLEERQDH